MTVAELLERIAAAYSGATAEAMKTFKPVFYARLRKHEGDALETAANEVLGTFKPKFDQKFPIPADFEAHLPSGKLNLPKDAGPALDVKGHGEKTRRIMAEWRGAQGTRGAGGVIEVLRSLEFIAEPLAGMKAWRNDPEPLRLTKAQLKLAQHRAISQQRVKLHGPPGKDPDVWWDQIDGIARGWGVATTRDEWTKDQPERIAA